MPIWHLGRGLYREKSAGGCGCRSADFCEFSSEFVCFYECKRGGSDRPELQLEIFSGSGGTHAGTGSPG